MLHRSATAAVLGLLLLQTSAASAVPVASQAGPITVTPAGGSIFSTNGIETCGPQTGVLGAAGASVTLNCPGAASYVIQLSPTSGQSALIGTITSTDPTTGGSRLLFKTGVGPLDISSVAMTGAQSALEYRTVGGVGGQTVTLTGYTSGSATVTITGSFNPQLIFTNNSSHSSDEAALRSARAWSISTGLQTVTAGQYMSVLLSNPSTSQYRSIIDERKVSCTSPTNALAPSWYSLRNPTTNLPTTALTVGNRKTGSAYPGSLTALINYSVTTFPDTATTAPLAGAGARTGGSVFDGGPGTVMTTLEPGQSIALTILSAGTGLTGTSNPGCAITVTGYDEAIN